MAERAKTLPSRAWSSTSLQAGVAHASAMSGIRLERLSKDDLIKKVQDFCLHTSAIYVYYIYTYIYSLCVYIYIIYYIYYYIYK